MLRSAQKVLGKVQDSGLDGSGRRTGLEGASSESSIEWDKRLAERATVEFLGGEIELGFK